MIVDQGDGTNVLRGGEGNDSITYSYYASNTIEGGAGGDLIKMDYPYYGSASYTNTFSGGVGNDRIESGASADTYLFNRGDGLDTINDAGYYNGGEDTLVFGAGIAASDLIVSRFGSDLAIRITDPANPAVNDQITIENWETETSRIEHVQFADGTVWDSGALNGSIVLATPYADLYEGSSDIDIYNGLGGDDQIYGFDGNDDLSGGAGNDLIDGGAGDDMMFGGTGDDTYFVDNAADAVMELSNEGIDTIRSYASYSLGANLENLLLLDTGNINGNGNELDNELTGNQFDNVLSGGTGNDSLIGGSGNDTYLLARGYGKDTIQENDNIVGNTDVALFDTDIAVDQLWFSRIGNNLEVSIIGTSDKLVIKDWYLGSDNHVEQFKTTDGAMTLLDSQVENLVNAMASFAPPAAGQTTLPPSYQTSLSPVIAANWQ